MNERFPAEYILPLRWTSDEGLADLTRYLRAIQQVVDVTVVDGSGPQACERHAQAWGGLVRHLRVTPVEGANGKVIGVLAGLQHARHDALIIADDDVRYGYGELREMIRALRTADLVRPQNYFDPLPWHARWDTARSLINRGVLRDFPGTYGVRRSMLEATHGYDARVLFENLELERTVRAARGVVLDRPDILVARRPPTTRHFLSQRVRQAYDSWAQPARLIAEALIIPVTVWASRRWWRGFGLVAGLLLVAERGRRRDNGASVFRASSLLWVPFWVAERGVTIWIAVGLRALGGVRYGSSRLRVAAHSVSSIERRLRRS